MAGDDCVRFFFSIVNNIKPDFTYHLSKILKKGWSKINTADFTLKDSLVSSALYKLGFEIYDNVSRNIDIDKDGEPEYSIKLIDEDFKLEKGDILLSNDHLHVYMGSGINPANNYGWGRVYREYPRVYNFNKVSDNNGIYYLIKEENNNDHRYVRIFRYVGER